MLTDKQFEATQLPESIASYFGFGFVPCSKRDAIGIVEHTRLGATRYYIRAGTIAEPKWRQTDYEGYFEHCKAIEPVRE